jgi:hypothetical protein
MKHERIVYDTREESGDLGTDALVSLVIQICTKTYQKKQKILHFHISAEYRTCILQLKFNQGIISRTFTKDQFQNISEFQKSSQPDDAGRRRCCSKASKAESSELFAPDFGESLKLER